MVGEINFGLIDPNTPMKTAQAWDLPAAFQQGEKNALAVQQARQQQAINALTLQKTQRDLADEQAVRNALANSGSDMNSAADVMIKGGQYKQGIELKKSLLDQQKARISQAIDTLNLGKAHADAVAANPTPENAVAHLTQFGQQTGQDMSDQISQVQNMTPDQIKDMAIRQSVGAKDLLPKIMSLNLGGTENVTSVDPVTGRVVGGQSFRKTATPGELLMDRRARELATYKVEHGIASLSPEENAALFGEHGAVTEGRLDPAKINSRTAKLFAQGEMLSPGRNDFVALTGDAALNRNAPFRTRAMTAEVVPELIQNMVATGKQLNYPDARFAGIVKQWTQGQLNDPVLAKYMAQRNDTLMTIAGVMRANGMTDIAHMAEVEAANPTMSPRALDAWAAGQWESLAPRLKQYRKYSHNADVSRENQPKGQTSIPQSNSKGWTLHVDANGNKAYVSPDGKQYEEVK